MRRQLDPLLAGRTIVAASAHPSAKFATATAALGHRVGPVRRRGKYLLADLVAIDDGARRELVVHLGMTGRLRPGVGPDRPYVRAWWGLDDGSHLAYGDVRRFGRTLVVAAGDHTALPTLHTLGPEPLGDDFTAERLWRSLRRSDVAVKTQLLGQRVVAGVGNIYADEALWQAGINPVSRRVGPRRAAALHGAIRAVLADAIAHGGTTVRDYRAVDGASGGFQDRLACYGRAGRPCGRCGTVLARRLVGARGTTWCPSCQAR